MVICLEKLKILRISHYILLCERWHRNALYGLFTMILAGWIRTNMG